MVAAARCRQLGEATRAWATWVLLSIDDAPPDDLVGVPAAVRASAAHDAAARSARRTAATSISRSSARATSAWTTSCGEAVRPPATGACLAGPTASTPCSPIASRASSCFRCRHAGAVPGALQLVGAGHRRSSNAGRLAARTRVERGDAGRARCAICSSTASSPASATSSSSCRRSRCCSSSSASMEDAGYLARVAFVIDRVMGARRAARQVVRADALGLLLRGAGRHGHAHAREPHRPAAHDDGAAADVVQRAAAHLRAGHRHGVRTGRPRRRRRQRRRGRAVCDVRAVGGRRPDGGRRASPDGADRAHGRRCCWSCRRTAGRSQACWLRATWRQVRSFLVDAGTIILALTIVMWALLNYPEARRPRRRRRHAGARECRRARRACDGAGAGAARLRLAGRRRHPRRVHGARGLRLDAGHRVRHQRRGRDRTSRCATSSARPREPTARACSRRRRAWR